MDSEKVQLEFVFKTSESPDKTDNMKRAIPKAERATLVDTFCISVCRAPCSCQDAEPILNHKLIMELDSCIASSHLPEAVLRQKYLENLLSTREIAQEFSCSKTRILDLLRKYNIPLRKQSEHRGSRLAYGKRRICGKTIDHKAELRTLATIKQMYSEGISTNAIARFLNTMKLPTKQQGKSWHGNTIIKILKREGVYVVGQKRRIALSA